MNAEQITNIAIKIGELGKTANFSLGIALLSGLVSLFCAFIAGYFKWKLNKINEEYQKQWAYISKKSLLIDNGIEVMAKMLFNKLILSYYSSDIQAQQNLFLLQKDALVIRSQLVVYSSLQIVESLLDFENLIVQTPNEKFREKWQEIYNKGNELLLLCRQHLGIAISEKFKEFAKKLIEIPGQPPPKEIAERLSSISKSFLDV